MIILDELPEEDDEVLVEVLVDDEDEVVDELDDVDAGWLLLEHELLLVPACEELEEGC